MLFWHIAFLTLLVGTTLFYTAVSLINESYASDKAREKSTWLENKCGVGDVSKLIRYNRLKTGFSALKTIIGLAFIIGFLYSDFFVIVLEYINSLALSNWLKGILLLVGALGVHSVLTIPFSAFSTFVIEENYGFNKQSVGTWLWRQFKTLMIGLVLYSILGGLIFYIVYSTTYWWIIGAGATVGFSFILMVAAPYIIVPLFYEYTKIEDGEVYEAIQYVLDKAGVKCEDVYEINGSQYSGHSNAYFTGFGPLKHIGLFDTLEEHVDERGVQSIFAHEIGHWQKGHVWWNVGMMATTIFAGFWAAQALVAQPAIYTMFGAPQETYIGLFLALIWLSPAMKIIQPIQNSVSRIAENQADAYAVKVMKDEFAQEGLADLVGENLSNPFVHPLYEILNHSHPSAYRRIKRTGKMKEQYKSNKKEKNNTQASTRPA